MADRGCNNGCGCAVPCPGGDACSSSLAGFISSVMSPDLSFLNSSDKLDSERKRSQTYHARVVALEINGRNITRE
ncbi:unnamed protein product [Musa banksii]